MYYLGTQTLVVEYARNPVSNEGRVEDTGTLGDLIRQDRYSAQWSRLDGWWVVVWLSSEKRGLALICFLHLVIGIYMVDR